MSQARSRSSRCTPFGQDLGTCWNLNSNYWDSVFSYSVFSVSLNTFTSCSPMAFAESVVDDYLTYYAEEKSSWSEV